MERKEYRKRQPQVLCDCPNEMIYPIKIRKNYNKINKEYKIMLDNIIGESQIIKNTKSEALMASKSTSTVLIIGESGTGK